MKSETPHVKLDRRARSTPMFAHLPSGNRRLAPRRDPVTALAGHALPFTAGAVNSVG
jgi:hypothetical protein